MPSGDHARPEALPRALTSRAGASVDAEIRAPDLPARDPRHALAARRRHRSVADAKPLRRAAVDATANTACSVPSCSCAGFGDLALPIRAVAAHVDDGLAVAGPIQVGDPQPIVTRVGRDGAPLVIGAARHRRRWPAAGSATRMLCTPLLLDTHAMRAAGWRGHQIGRKGRGHQRVDRQRGRPAGGCADGRNRRRTATSDGRIEASRQIFMMSLRALDISRSEIG